ncbi:hypothetical protein J2796_004657 [Chryseobacterium vietnamense]|jgi:hypothetical protein|nr:hypothetical protein [Chryseobacterium vietnamense]MDR6461522.1 hypothetical protein [Chryseobacterium sediminis]
MVFSFFQEDSLSGFDDKLWFSLIFLPAVIDNYGWLFISLFSYSEQDNILNIVN